MKNASKPLVSMIVPIYNVEEYLPQCIESLIDQSYDNLEIVLVDDGSPDNSGKIADRYAKSDKRIKVIHQKNNGVSSARNTGLDSITGEYVTFVDGDDYLAPDFVEYMLGLVCRTGSKIVMSTNWFTTSNNAQIDHDDIRTITPEDFMLTYLYPRSWVGSHNKMYKRDLIEQNQLRFKVGITSGEGLRFVTFAAQHVESVGSGLRKVYHYRTNNLNSATTKPDVEGQAINIIENINYIIENIAPKTPRLKKALEWHRWACYRYALLNIIGAKGQKEYSNLYTESISVVRALLPSVLLGEVSLTHKIRATLTAISPGIVLRVELTRRNYRLRRGMGK
jgi:glycosyltransferase involved in cell wall biosynthesis